MVDNCVTVGVVVLCGGMTLVKVVLDEGGGVDDVLAERAVDMGEEVIGVDVEAEDGGRVMSPEVGGGRRGGDDLDGGGLIFNGGHASGDGGNKRFDVVDGCHCAEECCKIGGGIGC
ncbi:hypothetical protein CBR_g50162 [Chara braunii]|uniref:Uncharacterized protein n=1 Tax=Chara braunii TaxID=69332 RepID=A0A388M6F7_CHABU|nr:hypothetical protein CBR_g50162 [Chara braunii]|eukprot:GBG90069.1 hypothetical protein CBR_g50162 [Chara braunii]